MCDLSKDDVVKIMRVALAMKESRRVFLDSGFDRFSDTRVARGWHAPAWRSGHFLLHQRLSSWRQGEHRGHGPRAVADVPGDHGQGEEPAGCPEPCPCLVHTRHQRAG